MPDKSYQNTDWQYRVRSHLRDGYGVEDIAVNLRCPVADVRREVEILREAGELQKIYEVKG